MRRMVLAIAPMLVLATAAADVPAPASAPPLLALKVSADRRSLVDAQGRPFFYLADTAWELLHRTDRRQAVEYLDTRARQKFTVIQAVALAELDGLRDPNSQGDLPFVDADPGRPAVTAGANPKDPQQYDYWDHVDFIVHEANQRGLYIALLPVWARWLGVHERERGDRVVTTANAQSYGEFLGKRYGRKGIIWVLGGDRVGAGFEEVWRALARGIAIGVSGREAYDAVLMTYHPGGGQTSSTWFHTDAWLDFNMQQTGHGPANGQWDKVTADYNLQPVKPVVDGEPLYEDHPVGFRQGSRQNGFSFDAHVRQRAYWQVFAGSLGVAYGNHAVWQMYAPGREPINGPLFYWYEAIHRPGAAQMQHLRALMESRPMLSRVPDQSIVVDTLQGEEHIQAARGDGYVFVYSAAGIKFTVNMGKIPGQAVKASWFNPRNGSVLPIGTFENSGTREFLPQYEGFGSDWVLVLDDVSKGFGPPGGTALRR
jgi:hypothetical protein